MKLKQRQVYVGLRRLAEIVILCIFDDSYNLAIKVLAGSFYSLAERILSLPEPARHSLIDDNHRACPFQVAIRYVAPFKDRDSHRFKIIGPYDVVSDLITSMTRWRRLPFDLDINIIAAISERDPAGQAYGLDTRHSR